MNTVKKHPIGISQSEPEKVKNIKKLGKLIVISGPSGAGKTTLIRKVMQKIPTLTFSVSATTRAIREGEIESVDYFFVSPEEFNDLIRNDAFIEWAKVHGNLYGTLKKQVKELREKRKNVILDIDEQGANQIKKKKIPALFIYILPPSLEELEKRLKERDTERIREMTRRLQSAKEQITSKGFYDHVIINDDIKKVVKKLKIIIEGYIEK
ncbi:MAG: guanylate kinase [Actinobacteria bacterium]|nr:guanylate kinase [Actinomycetota bacterium]